MTRGPVVAVIPAKDEADRIAETIAGVRRLTDVGHVVVVDDGSADRTGDIAAAAGAMLVTHPRNKGKAAAMTSGVDHAIRRFGLPDEAVILFVDADLEGTAANLEPLLQPVLAGDADMTIAILPAQQAPGGGKGRVVRLSRNGIRDLTGFEPTQPLSGMRAITVAAFTTATPLARGWGVETGLTVDVLRAGLRVVEVPCDLQHRVSGADWHGRLHRAAQMRDVAAALALRRLRRAGRPASP